MWGGGVAVGPVSRVADPYFLNADPDPAFRLNVNPDPAFHFNVTPDPAFNSSK